MKHTIQKALCLLLSLILSAGLFTGCGGEKKPLQICVDLGGAGRYQNRDLPAQVRNLVENVHDFGGPEDVEVEIIPIEGAERETAIKRVKTELMSGSGPDLFLVDTYDGNFYNTTPVFPIPQQLMDRRLFLPLDEYIENAQFMEWDKLNPQVMAAGHGEEGQLFLPLSYSFPVTCYKREDFDHTPSKDYTFADMVDDESGYLAAAGCFNQSGVGTGDWFHAVFGELADYAGEKLLFTEEDLYDALIQQLRIDLRYFDGAFDGLPWYQARMGVGMRPTRWSGEYGNLNMDYLHPDSATPLSMVPLYSLEGGVTAKVTSFAAINRNSKRPDEAFMILDYLLGVDAQRYASVYEMIYRFDMALPVYDDLLSPDLSCQHRSMSADNFQAYTQLRDQITAVTLTNALDWELLETYWDARDVLWDGDATTYLPIEGKEDELRQVVSEHYTVMEMELAES